LPSDVLEVLQHFHVAERSRVAWIVVVDKEYDVVEANNSYAGLQPSHVILIFPGGREETVTWPWMIGCLDSLCAQEQSLYPY